MALLTDAEEASQKIEAPSGRVLCHWSDFPGRPSSLFYVLGPFDAEATKDRFPPAENAEDLTPEQREQQVAR